MYQLPKESLWRNFELRHESLKETADETAFIQTTFSLFKISLSISCQRFSC